MEINCRKRKGPTPLVLDWAEIFKTEDEDDERPPENSYQSEDLEMVVKSERELRETIGRYKSNLKLCDKLRDGGKKLRENLKRHQDELERRQLLQKVDNECEETLQVSDSDDGHKLVSQKPGHKLAKKISPSTGDDDHPPNKKPKESSKDSYYTEVFILGMKSDRELNKAIARIKNKLKLCDKLGDRGKRLRAKLKRHKDVLEIRRKHQLLQKEREKMIQVSGDDGVSRGQKHGDRKSLCSPNFTKLLNKKLDKPEDGADRPPEIITSSKKPKESSEKSYQTEDLEMVMKSDCELNETIARIKRSLKQHEDELERRLKRQLLNKAHNECEEKIQVSDSDDGHKLVAGKGRSRMAVSSSSQEPSRSTKSGLVDSAKQITSNDDKSTSSFSVPNSPQVPHSSNLGPKTRPNYNLVDEDPPVQTATQFMEELDPCVELFLGLRKAWNDTKMSSKDAYC